MTETKDTKHEQLMEIGRNAFASIREMMAALECDYERLELLRDERAELVQAVADLADEDEDDDTAQIALEAWEEEWQEELSDLEEAASCCGEKCESREDAEDFIQADPLSIQFRGGWYAPGDEDKGGDAEEFEILLTTGGPAVRIIGEFGQGKQIHRVSLQVQDWFTPWTDYYEEGISDVLEAYCGALSLDCF